MLGIDCDINDKARDKNHCRNFYQKQDQVFFIMELFAWN
jgi:hypothetical protein